MLYLLPVSTNAFGGRWRSVMALVCGCLLTTSLAPAAEWQWSVELEQVVSTETKGHPRAFLWIPPNCKKVRAVVVGQHNMEEEPILEHAHFRAAQADTDVASVWVTPGIDLFFRFDHGAGERFQEMMVALAKRSGYSELETVPVIPIGHSAAASFPWNFAAWNPNRTLAVMSISGQFPYYVDDNTPAWEQRTVDGVPGLVTMGEYEWAAENLVKGLKIKAAHPGTALSMLAEPGAGHFAPTDDKVDFLAMYLRTAMHHRLPPGATKLVAIDVRTQGWLIDRWHREEAPHAAAAAVGAYKGDPAEAFWCFDAAQAKATEAFQARHRGKKVEVLGYRQGGDLVPQVNGTHQQVTLAWKPLPDGISFQLTGDFSDTVPPGRPERWTGQKEGTAIGHASGGGPVTITRICGPVRQTGPDTWALSFYRMGMDNPKRSNDIWFAASHPGDDAYRPMQQQAELRFPLRNTSGAEQIITFPALADQRPEALPLTLAAKSSSGLPVGYYVLDGPAEIEASTLRLTTIPPRSAFPLTVTVVAWQWGRSLEPKLKTAEPVVRTFHVTGP